MSYTTHKSHKTDSMAEFVREFDFLNPDWSSLPPGFPNLNKNGLSSKEMLLLDGIKLAWTASENGRPYFYKKTAKFSFVLTVFVISLIGLISLISSPNQSLTQEVSAKTISRTVGDIVESTASAILKK